MPRRAAGDLRHLGEGVAEDVVQDDATRSAGVIDSSTTRKAMLTDSSSVTRSAGSVPPGAPWPLGRLGQRLGNPFAHVALPPGPCRAEQVQADAAGDRGQPGPGRFDGILLLRDMAYQRAYVSWTASSASAREPSSR